MVHLGAGIADDLDALGEVCIAEEAKEGGEGLLLRKITGRTEDNDGGVVLQLLGSVVAEESAAAPRRCAKLSTMTWPRDSKGASSSSSPR